MTINLNAPATELAEFCIKEIRRAPATFKRSLNDAQKALDGDSNDSEHDALFDLVEFLTVRL